MKITLNALWQCCSARPHSWLIMDSEHGIADAMLPGCAGCAASYELHNGGKRVSVMTPEEVTAVRTLVTFADVMASTQCAALQGI